MEWTFPYISQDFRGPWFQPSRFAKKNTVTFSEGRGGEANEGGGDVSDMDTSTDGFMDFKDENWGISSQRDITWNCGLWNSTGVYGGSYYEQQRGD